MTPSGLRQSVDEWYMFKDLIKQVAEEVAPIQAVTGWSGKRCTEDDLEGYSKFTYFINTDGKWDFSLKIHNGYLQVRGRDIVNVYHEIPLGDPELKLKLKSCLIECENKPPWKVYGSGKQALI